MLREAVGAQRQRRGRGYSGGAEAVRGAEGAREHARELRCRPAPPAARPVACVGVRRRAPGDRPHQKEMACVCKTKWITHPQKLTVLHRDSPTPHTSRSSEPALPAGHAPMGAPRRPCALRAAAAPTGPSGRVCVRSEDRRGSPRCPTYRTMQATWCTCPLRRPPLCTYTRHVFT